MKNGINQTWDIAVWESAAAGGHLVEHRACCIDICPRIGTFSQQLLWRHVGQCSRHTLRSGGALSYLSAGRLHQLCQAEVENFEAAIRRNHYIGGLEVAVDNAMFVGDG